MPTSGKGTLGTWWFHFQRGGRTQSRHQPTHELELSYEQTIRSRGVCAPALKPRGEWEGSRTKCQGFKPDLGNSAVRHYRGAFESVAMVEMRTQLAIERAGLVTLHLQPARRSSIPTTTRASCLRTSCGCEQIQSLRSVSLQCYIGWRFPTAIDSRPEAASLLRCDPIVRESLLACDESHSHRVACRE
jgi:hypothetical protein